MNPSLRVVTEVPDDTRPAPLQYGLGRRPRKHSPARFIAYIREIDRPTCKLCEKAPETGERANEHFWVGKRAVFFDRRRQHPVCARHMVMLADASKMQPQVEECC